AGPFPVTITSTDDFGNKATDSFTYTVINVAPRATLQTNSGAAHGNAATAALVSPVDPSAADVSAGSRYTFALDADTTGSPTYANSGPISSRNFGVIAEGTHTVYARIFDKDGGSTLYTLPLVIAPGNGLRFTVTSTLDSSNPGSLHWAVDQAN